MLKELNCPTKLINLIKATLKITEIKIKVIFKASSPVKINTGLRQGYSLSSILFYLLLVKVIRKTDCNNRIVLGN